jgi:hypothetical protein
MLEYLEILYIFFFFFLPGATRTNDAKELMYARQKIINCAKAYRLQAIDMVYIDYKGKKRRKKCIKFLNILAWNTVFQRCMKYFLERP